jgi:hypothetical protein
MHVPPTWDAEKRQQLIAPAKRWDTSETTDLEALAEVSVIN